MSLKPKVALAQDFLLQMSKLPVSVQSKVMKWAILFQTDPTSPGINYEKINAARDPNLKSVRLGDDWRGIVFKPEKGDVYVLLYVDRHDDAYRWAESKKLAINPVTGAMQLISLEQVTQAEEVAAAPSGAADAAAHTAPNMPAAATDGVSVGSNQTSEPAEPLFRSFDDRELMSLGVPEELLGLVRKVHSDLELDTIQPQLPVEAYEGLFLVAAGDSVSQVLGDRETRVDREVDTADFAAALATPESQSRFVVITDDETMSAILNAPLAQWRVFLHPTQQKLAVGDRSGPVRVLGGAGTGKTVLALHRAKWLAENRTTGTQKVLFTTFTKNLASDIEQNLKTLCGSSTMDKIEVRNLDAWVAAFMRSRRLEHRIVYDRRQEGASQAWMAAMAVRDTSLDVPEAFYQQELEQVVLAQGITTLDGYRTVRRTGRGIVLNRAKRDAVWPVFEEYRGQLASRKLKEVDDAYREVADLLTADAEKTAVAAYSAIVIDETQDFGPQALKLLRAMIPRDQNDLFFVGDGHQRIYSRNKAAMSRCGIDIRGRSRKLYINYRTTDEIRRRAVALLEGVEIDDLDDGHDETKRYRSLSHGPAPAVVEVFGLEAAFAEVAKFHREWLGGSSGGADLSFCVVAATEKARDAIGQQLAGNGIKTMAITAQTGQTDERGVVYLATMHRAKGLEFDCVAVVSPSAFMTESAEDGHKRQLLYVALTRAKRGAILALCK